MLSRYKGTLECSIETIISKGTYLKKHNSEHLCSDGHCQFNYCHWLLRTGREHIRETIENTAKESCVSLCDDHLPFKSLLARVCVCVIWHARVCVCVIWHARVCVQVLCVSTCMCAWCIMCVGVLVKRCNTTNLCNTKIAIILYPKPQNKLFKKIPQQL